MRKALWTALAASLLSLPAFGSLILISPEDFQGTGLGNVNTVLTVHDNDGTEQGCVGWNGSATVTGIGACSGSGFSGATNEQAQNNSFTLGGLLISDLADLRVVFNASEPGGAANNSVTLDQLVLTLYSPTGTLLFSSGDAGPFAFPDTQNGAGNSGFVFALDGPQLTQAVTAVAGQTLANVRVGLSARVSNAQGGLETFFVAPTATPSDPIPEPSTLLTLGAGLIVVALARRRS